MANPLARFAVRAVAAAASRQIASRVSGSQLGPIGNVAAVALPFALRRVSPLGLAAMAVGVFVPLGGDLLGALVALAVFIAASLVVRAIPLDVLALVRALGQVPFLRALHVNQ
jgi:hypothetical protein